MLWWITFALGWFLALLWLAPTLPLYRFLTRARLSRCAGKLPDPPVWPRISVIAPARDEAERIEEALQSLSALDYPDFEVIAIDDRSTDGTGEVMDRLAAQEQHLVVEHVTELPERWLGKCHALHLGARRATGDLLLFTDGDVTFQPETLRLAARYMAHQNIDHLALLPGLDRGGFWEDALKSYFALIFLFGMKAWAARSPNPRHYIGIGAFNLVRRTAYEAAGGHEALRLEIVDDVNLGRIIKEAGFKQDVLLAPDHLGLFWYHGVGGFIRGLEKNAYAAIGYSVPLLLILTLAFGFYYALPYLGLALFMADARIWGYVATLLVMHGIFGYTASHQGRGWLMAPVLPIMALLYCLTLWRSAHSTYRQRGVRWRDTFYPLADLQAARAGETLARPPGDD